jgi:hypothetical protein
VYDQFFHSVERFTAIQYIVTLLVIAVYRSHQQLRAKQSILYAEGVLDCLTK